MSRIRSKQYFLALCFLLFGSLLASAAGESSSHDMVKGEEVDSSELKSAIPDIFTDNSDLASSTSRKLLMGMECTGKNRRTAFCKCKNRKRWNREKCKELFTHTETVTRIIGGTEVSGVGTYPWFARATVNNHASSFGCGGSLVAPEFVLTAAHCINNNFRNSQPGYDIGSLCTSQNNNCGQFNEKIRVAEIITHPGYNGNSLDNDFALARLVTKSTITPVKMDQGNIVDNYVSGHRNLWPIGYGDIDPSGGFEAPDRIHHVETAYVTRAQCNNMYGAGNISPNMMCAAENGKDSCQGDSGGPLYDRNENIKALVGVVSWGYGCADPRFPGVYSKISSQWSWIKQTICAGHSAPKPTFCGDSPPQDAPTKAPSPSTPDNCPSGQKRATVFLKTDNYPSETSWTIEGPSGVVASNGPLEKMTEYTTNECLPTGNRYVFTINDTYGDGLTENGVLVGSYSVSWDGEILKSGGVFTDSESVTFGVSSPAPSKSPSAAPVPDTPITCPNGQAQVSVIINTDDFPGETAWKIFGPNGEIFASDPYDMKNYEYKFEECLATNDPYNFIITDTFGDGLTIDGVQSGSYTLSWDGDVVKTGGVFERSEEVPFNVNYVCAGSDTKAIIEVKTDNFPDETTWTFREDGGSTIAEYPSDDYPAYAANTVYKREVCVPEDGCYRFIINDSYGDGICCSEGDGYFQVTFDGVVYSRNFKRGSRKRVFVGNC